MKKLLLAAAVATAIGVTSLATAAPAFAYERWLRVHNNTSGDEYWGKIIHVYTSCRDCSGWSRDLLRGSIPPGHYKQTMDPGWSDGYCKFDVLAVFKDGTEVRSYMNLCLIEDWYIRD